MNTKRFIALSVEAVVNYFNNQKDNTDKNVFIAEDDVFVVWLSKTLQNNKALLSTTIPDGMYYEITYSGDKKELYLDAYKKWQNKCIKIESGEV